MPEFPDIEAYLAVLRREVTGRAVIGVRVKKPFLVRTISPALKTIEGQTVNGFRRLGKRVVFEFAEFIPTRFVVVHLMKAGRFRWGKPGAGLPGRMGLCAFDFEHGTLILTEAGNRRRASLHVLDGEEALGALDPGGLEVMETDLTTFSQTIRARRHTLKRALTDPHILSGIGSAYADEILLRARLSPMRRTDQLAESDIEHLWLASRSTLLEWKDRIIEQTGAGWPKVTAFREEMAAHGKAGHPCPVCSSTIQRIVYKETETNYCPTCQTDGKVLKDRALSRLLKDDWPSSLDEMEARGSWPPVK